MIIVLLNGYLVVGVSSLPTDSTHSTFSSLHVHTSFLLSHLCLLQGATGNSQTYKRGLEKADEMRIFEFSMQLFDVEKRHRTPGCL